MTRCAYCQQSIAPVRVKTLAGDRVGHLCARCLRLFARRGWALQTPGAAILRPHRAPVRVRNRLRVP